jgi:hypothetical protein
MMKRLVIRYEWLILCGLLISSWAFLNVLGITNTPSDVFWALFGLGAAAEGVIELYWESKQETLTFGAVEGSEESAALLTQKMNKDPLGGVVTVTHGSVGLTMSFYAFRSMILQHDESKDDEDNE